MYSISILDWCVIGVYLLGLIALALWLSRHQENHEDYFVGGRSLGAWPIAISIMATQCSTNSILGAPAFVAFAPQGGLSWLQYELAVPLAMIVLMLVFLPTYRQLKLITVYQYLEYRFSRTTRLCLSGTFMFVRAFATAVTVYSIAIVIDLITGIGFFSSVLILGLFTAVYDVLGGIKGVIYSDLIQMAILFLVLLIVAILLTSSAGGITALLENFSAERRSVIDFSAHGIGDGATFSFWPMLFGGFFLYISYYGCDQSQVQRQLCAKNLDSANASLFINGLLRFPLVALYCFVGVGIAVYAQSEETFLQRLPEGNINLAVPAYMIEQLPTGLVGLGLVALFAAAMSSLDSVLNSLGASTMEDFIRPKFKDQMNTKQELYISRIATFSWGVLTLIMAFFVGDISASVLEAINKIGSLINGPILGVFFLGLLTCFCNSMGAITGLFIGFAFNALLWVFIPAISWLWWNVFGFAITISVGFIVSFFTSPPKEITPGLIWSIQGFKRFSFKRNWIHASILLAVWFLILFFTLSLL